MKLLIKTGKFTIKELEILLHDQIHAALSSEAIRLIQDCRDYLEEKLIGGGKAYYGINTGFGSLCDVRIADSEIEALQLNLVKSHACGAGEEVPNEIVRIILFLKILSLSKGHSGVRLELVEFIIQLFNRRIYPVIYQLGSLGASGDLAPLSHLAIALIGEGEVYYNDRKEQTSKILKKLNISPLSLKAKEGLALLNGTQFSTGYGVWCVLHSYRIIRLSNYIAALSVLAFNGKIDSFDPKISKIRSQKGQGKVARQINTILRKTKLQQEIKISLQDPYSFRCIPQVHGASLDTIDFVNTIVEREVNSVTDNPNLFPSEDEIISAGNFHAQSIALAMDFLAIALSELGNISERRVYHLLSGTRGLPVFLTEHPGLHSGLMITQYTAASIVNQNKALCTPNSVDSIISSNGQEDHVSMSANSATKCYKLVENTYKLLSIEFLVVMQALEYRNEAIFSSTIKSLKEAFRKIVPSLGNDRILYEDLKKTEQFVRQMNN